MDVRPLKTEADYNWALAEARKYFASEPARGTPQGDRFEVLLALIENYETLHHAVGTPEPIAAIKGDHAAAAFFGSRHRGKQD
jgi:HTH-type transcriptional regulator / antitoxin HigA